MRLFLLLADPFEDGILDGIVGFCCFRRLVLRPQLLAFRDEI
ncbi:hypothetical protein [Mesorhizobium sp. M5C.F.Ca.ET.164.01.1.1]|nr:hypothetical protein [Mesorhizobium sp. M5C.F.Ca.ET.164.01.1.1]